MLKQNQETISSLQQSLEAREQFKAERELIEKNNKLAEEVSRLRKREHKLKAQLTAEEQKHALRALTAKDSSEVNELMADLDMKKKTFMQDMEDDDGTAHLKALSQSQRK